MTRRGLFRRVLALAGIARKAPNAAPVIGFGRWCYFDGEHIFYSMLVPNAEALSREVSIHGKTIGDTIIVRRPQRYRVAGYTEST